MNAFAKLNILILWQTQNNLRLFWRFLNFILSKPRSSLSKAVSGEKYGQRLENRRKKERKKDFEKVREESLKTLKKAGLI